MITMGYRQVLGYNRHIIQTCMEGEGGGLKARESYILPFREADSSHDGKHIFRKLLDWQFLRDGVLCYLSIFVYRKCLSCQAAQIFMGGKFVWDTDEREWHKHGALQSIQKS